MEIGNENNSFSKNPQSQIYLILGVFALVIFCLVLFLSLPNIKEIRKVSNDLVSGRKNLAFLEEQVREVEKFKQNVEAYRPNLEKISSLFVDSKNPAGFFEFLEKTAMGSGVDLKVSLNGGIKKDAKFLSFQVFASGEFSKVIGLLEKLETGRYILEIQNLSISSIEEGVNANFLIMAYAK